MQKKQEEKKELDSALDEFNEAPLNLTNEDKDDKEDDPELAAKIQAEYEKFMSDMKSNSLDGDDNFDGLADALGGLLKGLGESLGLDGKEEQSFKKMFQGNADGNMEDLAGKLLEVFMKKELLYEPLQESRQNYESFFKKQQGKIPQGDLERFTKQHETIKEILKVLDQQPQNKKKLMDLFEKMQDYGQPPEGITSVTLPNAM